MAKVNEYHILSNGVKIPSLGFGSWQSPNTDVTSEAMVTAIEAGYRHIDAAAVYGNEKSVGRGIKASGIKREDLFLTSKVWNTEHGYQSTLNAFEQTINDLQVDYLDLYLIHWPVPHIFKDCYIEKNAETWEAMEKLYSEGKIKAIGISNFLPHHIEELMQTAKETPMINQIEFHPSCLQEEVIPFCRNMGIAIEGYSPLANGRVFQVEELAPIAAKYGKNVAQLCIRWSLEKGVVTIPKSVTRERIIENFNVFDFELTPEDTAFIDSITTCVGAGDDPDNIDF